MGDYISRAALKEAFDNADADVCESYPDGHCDWGFGRKTVNDVIDCVPAADVEPVLNGNYKRLGTFTVLAEVRQCFVCRCNYLAETTFKRCPICGVYTDLEV